MDMLVKLYNVADDPALFEQMRQEGITFRRVIAPDLNRVLDFVQEHFSENWVSECTVAIMRGHCWIAVKEKQVIGFACYDTTMPDFFGPTGVRPDMRGRQIGKALLLRALLSMKEMGYAYAIIGWTGPQAFYAKCVGATPIPNSIPYSYHNMICVDTDEQKGS